MSGRLAGQTSSHGWDAFPSRVAAVAAVGEPPALRPRVGGRPLPGPPGSRLQPDVGALRRVGPRRRRPRAGVARRSPRHPPADRGCRPLRRDARPGPAGRDGRRRAHATGRRRRGRADDPGRLPPPGPRPPRRPGCARRHRPGAGRRGRGHARHGRLLPRRDLGAAGPGLHVTGHRRPLPLVARPRAVRRASRRLPLAPLALARGRERDLRQHRRAAPLALPARRGRARRGGQGDPRLRARGLAGGALPGRLPRVDGRRLA